MKNDVLSKINTLKEVLNIAEDKLSKNELSINSASKVNLIVETYLAELKKEVLN